MEVSLEQVKQWSLFVERETARFPELLQPFRWESAYPPNELRCQLVRHLAGAETLAELNKCLRESRRAEMVRTAIRDLKGLAPVEEVMQDASELADGLVEGALQWHTKEMVTKFGDPIGEVSGEVQRMIVIGMGKLGGSELNFSSDIDLIFVYPEKGKTNGSQRKLQNSEFFTRLGQAMNKSLSEFTADGPVFRVDMRLRPFGSSGPLASSFAEMEHYYQLHGRAWERYALVKARVIAGDFQKGAELSQILKPFVYRKYIDFSAMDSLRELKAMIHAEVKKKDKLQNIKLGPGGIREVEFVVQAFQLIHGGRDPELQRQSLLPTLARLPEKQFLESELVAKLKASYLFLRKTENHLQEWNDKQTHDLPSESNEQWALSQAMGFKDYDAFIKQLDQHRDLVQSAFDSVFSEFSVQTTEGETHTFEDALFSFDNEIDLSEWKGASDEQIQKYELLLNRFLMDKNFLSASNKAVTRFKSILPILLEGLQDQVLGEKALENTLKVIGNVMRRSVYLVLLKENPQAVEMLLTICGLSDWLTDTLVKYPALMDQLIDERALYTPPQHKTLLEEVETIRRRHQNDTLPKGDDESFMNDMRQWRHTQIFRVAAADVTGNVPVNKVSDYLTWIAEAVLQGVTDYAWFFMQAKHGSPSGMSLKDPHPFMILGYGKLGGIELGYGSDLDVVFLYQGLESSSMSSGIEGKRALENGNYFIRMGQKIISLMTTAMPTGTLYEVDTRLRPNGNRGMLVTTFDSYCRYIEDKAWVWEHQALVRARLVTGSEASRKLFTVFKSTFMSKTRAQADIKAEVREMRQKMRDSLDRSSDTLFDLKQAEGGIIDIEFMVQYFVLAFSNQYPELTKPSDDIHLLEAIKVNGLLAEDAAEDLKTIYKAYRAKYHILALENSRALVPLDSFLNQKTRVMTIWREVML